MKKPVMKDIFIPIISLLLICIVSSGLLGAVNAITKDRIAASAAQDIVDAQAALLPADTYREDTLDGSSYTTALGADGSVCGYIFTTSANGYGGSVKIMTGIGTDGTVKGVSILTLNETPGLGMKAKEDSFLRQFAGVNGTVGYTKDNNGAGNTVNAITSATITTKAFVSAVNKALALYEAVKEVENNG